MRTSVRQALVTAVGLALVGGPAGGRSRPSGRRRDGQLRGVAASGPGEERLEGSVQDDEWRSHGQLVPDSTYRLTATVRDTAGTERELPVLVRTSQAAQLLTASLRPGDDAVVGVGQPVAVVLDVSVSDAAARRAVVERLEASSLEPVVRPVAGRVTGR